MKFKIETASGRYTVLAPVKFTDKDEILDYYHIHDVFSVSRFIDGQITLIPKHAIQAIIIQEDSSRFL